MAEAWMETVGLAAGALTTLSFLPQVVKTWRTKAVRDLSLRMYLCLSSGVLLWLVYGVCVGSPSIVVANGLTLVLCLFILFMKLRYDRRP